MNESTLPKLTLFEMTLSLDQLESWVGANWRSRNADCMALLEFVPQRPSTLYYLHKQTVDERGIKGDQLHRLVTESLIREIPRPSDYQEPRGFGAVALLTPEWDEHQAFSKRRRAIERWCLDYLELWHADWDTESSEVIKDVLLGPQQGHLSDTTRLYIGPDDRVVEVFFDDDGHSRIVVEYLGHNPLNGETRFVLPRKEVIQ